MRKKILLCGVLIGFSIACIMGMKTRQNIEDIYKEKIISINGKTVEYFGKSDDEITFNDLIYSDGDYNYYLNTSQGYVERIIACSDDGRMEEADFSEEAISEIEEKAKKYTELYTSNRSIHWNYSSEVSEGSGCTITAIGYNEEDDVSGDEALLVFDSKMELVIAVFMPNVDELEIDQEGIKEEEAIEIAKDAAEAYTLKGMIEGSECAEKVSINKITEVKKTYWKGCWYYDISMDAEVEFSDRGLVHKTYDVRINANTGVIADDIGVVWSLE